VDGPDLQSRVASGGPLTVEQLVMVGCGIAEALAAAHRHGILHRDVKPQNILLAPDGRARLTDFGSARLDGQATVTQTGGLVGTLAYMAPDVLAGGRGDARSDVYSLGMTLYFAATGALPPGTSPHLPPAPAPDGRHPRSARHDVPEWLDSIIARATAADPRDRFPAATLLAEALERRSAQPAIDRPAAGLISDRCVLCGAADDSGIGVCLACRVAPTPGDALVFVRREREAVSSAATRTAVATLLPSASDRELRDVLRGERPLVRVRADAAEGVLLRLEGRGVTGRWVPARRVWTALPLSFHAVLGLVVGVALAMGGVGHPLLLGGGVGVATLMVVGALGVVRRPLLSSTPAAGVLAPGRARADGETALPPGPARALLSDVQRLAALLLAAHPSARETDDVAALVQATSDVAREVARLDETLRVLEAQRDRVGASARWAEATSACASARDRLVQRMLDVVTVLGKATAQASDRGDAAVRIGELTTELERTVRVEADAARDVDALLAS
jgi:hypothetical protein